MTHITAAQFEAGLEDLLARRDGPAAVHTFVHDDPSRRYAVWFNDCMGEVDADGIGPAYLKPQAVVATKVSAGLVTTLTAFLETVPAVLLVTALHHRVKSYHRAHPRVPRAAAGGGTAGSSPPARPLFVPAQHPERFVDPGAGPAATAELGEVKRAALRAARRTGRLPLQAYRRVREYEAARGTTYGAYRHVARLAVLDADGRIVRFGRAVDEGAAPPAAVVRRVRRLCADAAAALAGLTRGRPRRPTRPAD